MAAEWPTCRDHGYSELLTLGVERVEVAVVQWPIPGVSVDVGGNEAVIANALLENSDTLHAIAGIDAVHAVDPTRIRVGESDDLVHRWLSIRERNVARRDSVFDPWDHDGRNAGFVEPRDEFVRLHESRRQSLHEAERRMREASRPFSEVLGREAVAPVVDQSWPRTHGVQ